MKNNKYGLIQENDNEYHIHESYNTIVIILFIHVHEIFSKHQESDHFINKDKWKCECCGSNMKDAHCVWRLIIESLNYDIDDKRIAVLLCET